MATKISITNFKGGVGKSSTAINLADALMYLGYKVLLIDLDPQSNSTSHYIKEIDEDQATLFDVFTGACELKDAIVTTSIGDIILGDKRLTRLDKYREIDVYNYNLIKDQIKPIDKKYDFVIFDTPPGLGTFTGNAINAADGLIVPTQVKKFSFDGLSEMIEYIKEVRKSDNKKLKIYGILATMYDSRNAQDKNLFDVLPAVGSSIGFNVFTNPIRINQEIEKALVKRVSLFRTKPSCNGAVDYANLTKELIEML